MKRVLSLAQFPSRSNPAGSSLSSPWLESIQSLQLRFKHKRITAGAIFVSANASSISIPSQDTGSSRWITVAFTRPKLWSRFSPGQRRGGLLRQQKDHPGKLRHRHDELIYDAGKKWPERGGERYVVQLQEQGYHAKGS